MHPKNSPYQLLSLMPSLTACRYTSLSCGALGMEAGCRGRAAAAAAGKRVGNAPRNRLPICVVLVRCGAVGASPASSLVNPRYCSSPGPICLPTPRPHFSTTAPLPRTDEISVSPIDFIVCEHTSFNFPALIHSTVFVAPPLPALFLSCPCSSEVQSAAH